MSGAGDPVVVVGTGLAGYTVARELRKHDKQTALVMLTADGGSFYSKPMISNALGRGQQPADLPTATAQKMAADLGAVIRTHVRVTAVQPGAHEVVVDGERLRYRALVLALGADPLRLALAGDAAGEVHSINDLDDYARFREALTGRHHVAVLGAGLIGTEFANDLVASGHAVEVVEVAAHALGRLVPEQAGRAVQRALEAKGVRFHFGTACERVEHDGERLVLTLADGTTLHADLVLSAVGLRPRTGLARAAGIASARGIIVDRYLRTSAPDVYALGDCMEIEGVVLPFIMPIMHAGRALAQTLTGAAVPLRYPPMPVVVKTPAHPVVVAPPPPGTTGTWEVEGGADGVRALYVEAGGRRLGFALSGARVTEKTALARELPPVIG